MSDIVERAFSRKYVTQWLYAGSIALFIIFGIVWWTKVYENPYNVYWDMLRNSMQVTGVTKHVSEQANGTNLSQYVGLNFGVNNQAYARTTLQDANGIVKTESIGTMQNDYVRYTSIQTTTKGAKQPDAKNVLNKWAKTPAANTSDTSVSVPFFVQVLLGFEGGNLVPMGNLPPATRDALIQQLHNNVIFQTSFNDVKRQMMHGRPVYSYPVTVEPVAYVAFEKAYAQAMGIKALDTIDPNSYQGQTAVKVVFQVDAWSHQLVGITYPGSSHTESYTSYGVATAIQTPQTTISNTQLQSLLSAVQ